MPQLGGKPDLIIGNYSDGNLVASLLSHYLSVTQCTIAHALEKTKYQVRLAALTHESSHLFRVSHRRLKIHVTLKCHQTEE